MITEQLGASLKHTALFAFALAASAHTPAARAAGIPIPYPGFNSTVQRALQPFPQYQTVFTAGGQPASVGERAGSSTYHAMILKLDKRYSNGLTLLGSCVISKFIGPGLSGDDQTHLVRVSFSYELPWGKGRRWALGRAADPAFGGWGISGFTGYESGTPYGVGPGISPIGTSNRPFVTSYDNWSGSVGGSKFDPFRDSWWDRNALEQGISTERLNSEFGNSTRLNPKARSPWILNENVSVAKNFRLTETVKLSFRWEAFNLFNRTLWGGPTSTVTAALFGTIRSQANTPRQMQMALEGGILIALLAALLLAQSPFQDAVRAFEAERYADVEHILRGVHPRGFDAQFLLGAALVRLGRGEEAVAELKAAHAKNPAHMDALKLLASEQLRLGRAGEVIGLLRPRLDRLPGDEELHLLLLQAYQQRGDAGDAEAGLALATKALARFPKSAPMHAWMGHELRESGRLAEARRQLEEALRLDPSDVFARVVLADVFVREGRFEEGRSRLSELLAAHPDDVDARVSMSRALAGLGRTEEAAAELERGVALAPDRARLHLELSRLYSKLGNEAKAKEAADRFRKLQGR